jgi:hypothetical protein
MSQKPKDPITYYEHAFMLVALWLFFGIGSGLVVTLWRWALS